MFVEGNQTGAKIVDIMFFGVDAHEHGTTSNEWFKETVVRREVGEYEFEFVLLASGPDDNLFKSGGGVG